MMKLPLFLALLTLSSCVSKGRFQALEAENERHANLLKTEEEKTKLLSDQVSKLEGNLASTNRDRTNLEMSVDEMKQAIADLEKRKAEADKRVAEFRDLVSRFKTLIDAGKLQVKINDGRMVVEMATDVLFPSGSAQLSKDGVEAITEVAQKLAEIEDRKFQIEGHTDNVPIRTAQYPSNWELASARSLTVVRTMLAAGMPSERISAASFAEVRPAQSNETAAGKSANRRIEIVIVPDLSGLPGFDELSAIETSPGN